MGYNGVLTECTFVILVLRRIQQWKEQKDRQISSGADEGISRVNKRYSPFNHWQDGLGRNLENQEQVHDKILEGMHHS